MLEPGWVAEELPPLPRRTELLCKALAALLSVGLEKMMECTSVSWYSRILRSRFNGVMRLCMRSRVHVEVDCDGSCSADSEELERAGPVMTSRSHDRDVMAGPSPIPSLAPEPAAKDLMSNTSDPAIFLKTCERSVIRCWAWYKSYEYKISWDAGSAEQNQSIPINFYAGEGSDMTRMLFTSIIGRKSRNITCSSNVHQSKSQRLEVIDRGFIIMDTSTVEHDIDPKQDFCLVVEFRAYPAARCAWIHNSKVSPCSIIKHENMQSANIFRSALQFAHIIITVPDGLTI
ncbi:unnamed protein product [Ranitomeya imitator]|uniref:Ig-like domain-containing protein n=1 Tax=Ranitomeya imitator TaxID=111125 RepID=A0ABN9M9M4_9NEOB|nr:unnamed protein product [Ranitomeya imitator]